MTYQEYTTQRQQEFNKLPIFFAFSNDQFREGMEKLGLTENDTDKIYKLGMGGFYRKADAHLVRAWVEADRIDELMKDYEFCKSAVYYEMCNHEYSINWQADFDVMSCFAKIDYYDGLDELQNYWEQAGWNEEQCKAYLAARREYYRQAEENDWF